MSLGPTKGNATTPKAAADTNQSEKKADPVPKTFTGGEQGFVDLKLVEVLPYNDNTKRFKFELPEKDAVSGVTVTCKLWTLRKPVEGGTEILMWNNKLPSLRNSRLPTRTSPRSDPTPRSTMKVTSLVSFDRKLEAQSNSLTPQQTPRASLSCS